MMLVLTNVRGLVYSGCPRSCLMAHSDRGHPSVWSLGPTVPIAIKKKRREGCLRHAFPEAPPPLTRMKKKQEEEKAMTRTAMSLPGLPILVPGRPGRPSHSLPPEAAREDAMDPTSRRETSSARPNATRRQSVVPVVKTRLLFSAPPIPGHNRRTGLPSRLPSRSIAGFTGYTPNLHSAHGGAMSKGKLAESGKESRPDDVPMRPFQLPYLYQRVFIFFFAPTP